MTASQESFPFDAMPSFERFVDLGFRDGARVKVIDIPETIPQLGYGTHQFFRYYGKFPSLLGREIISNFALPGHSILDCYSGSGTTLVEAQIAGHVSYGLDINPLATLASRAKTRYYDLAELQSVFAALLALIESGPHVWKPQVAEERVAKWFSPAAVEGLGGIRTAIVESRLTPEIEGFFLTAFLGIVRRCSNAFDGEVRPHVKRDKRPRPPRAAFADKVNDMLTGLRQLDRMRPLGIESEAWTGDNRSPVEYDRVKDLGLVVAHPPYLNSFNYLGAFSLELMWAAGLDSVWEGWSERDVRRLEQKAHPATDSALVVEYYDSIRQTIKASTESLVSGGSLAVVVGDATIRGQLEPVVDRLWDELCGSMVPRELWYRTTHYGIGKYAYSHRADYHGDATKRDGILFFSKR